MRHRPDTFLPTHMNAMPTAAELAARHCQPMEGMRAHDEAAIAAHLVQLPNWQVHDGALQRTLAFRDYHETIAFVNALAWMIHREDHHPDLIVGYDRCTVRWNTHSVGGLSDNDFICAARTDALFDRGA